jgi:hypothetical protein
MVVRETEDFGALHERVLRFMGAFSTTQFAIDTIVGFYLSRRMPELGPELEKQFLRRIRDDQRLPLFNAFAAQVKYDGDLTHFELIYHRAKHLRDKIGHSLNVTAPVYAQGKVPVVAVASASRANFDLIPDPLLPSTFTHLTADCEWITQHVYRAGYTAEPGMFKDLTLRPYEPLRPPPLPAGGEPLPQVS